MQTGSAETVGLSTTGLEAARDYVAGCVGRGELPGAVMLVAGRDQVVQLACVGLRDIEALTPMEPDTIFRIASMTKPMVSVSVLMLVEAGKLRLDDSVSRYIPEFADAKAFAGVENGQIKLAALERPITVYDLLTHTSGLAYEPPHPALEPYDLWDATISLNEFMRRLAERPLAHQPGSDWSYGFSHEVLGRVIEVVADQPADDYLSAAVFAPLGMDDTGFYVPPDKVNRLSTVYQVSEAGYGRIEAPNGRVFTRPPVMVSGGGGAASTALDYFRFASMLLHRGELDGVRLLKPETVDLMTRNHLSAALYPVHFVDFASAGEGYGFGVGIAVEPEQMAYGGSIGAYHWSGTHNSHFWVDPLRQVIGIILTNANTPVFHVIPDGFRLRVNQAIIN